MTKTEKQIMQILWENENPLCAADIIESSDMKEITVRTTLANMLQKELIRVEGMVHRTKSYARAFVANVTPEDLVCKEILECKYTTVLQISKYIIGNLLSNEEVKEIQTLIKEKCTID